MKKNVRAAAFAALSIAAASLLASCAGWRPFVDSSPAPAEDLGISDEGWKGSSSTEIAGPDRPAEAEEAAAAEGNAAADRITF